MTKRLYALLVGVVLLGVVYLGLHVFFFKDSSSSQPKKFVKNKTICLNMIVKDEKPVITRCLATVKPLIDYWVIVDTGSTDGTQNIIKEYMKDIPGELHERPWVDFAHNRNLALDLAKNKGDYLLIIDADEMLEYAPNFTLPPLDAGAYNFTLLRGSLEYQLPTLIQESLNWRWHGVLHEYLASAKHATGGHLQGVFRTTKSDGNRSQDPEKYKKDAALLEKGVKDEPNNERYVFYLAQSYRDAGEYTLAIQNYEKRVAMQKWPEEVFYSLWQIARLKEFLGKDPKEIEESYYKAYLYRPTRAEPLYDLARYYRSTDRNDKAYQITSVGKTIPPTTDILFVDAFVYDYGMQLEHSVAAYWIGNYEESQKISQDLLSKTSLPDDIRTLVSNNLGFANAKLIEQQTEI